MVRLPTAPAGGWPGPIVPQTRSPAQGRGALGLVSYLHREPRKGEAISALQGGDCHGILRPPCNGAGHSARQAARKVSVKGDTQYGKRNAQMQKAWVGDACEGKSCFRLKADGWPLFPVTGYPCPAPYPTLRHQLQVE